VPVGDAQALAAALSEVLARAWDPAAIRARVAGMTWAENARATHAFLAAALRRPPLRARAAPSTQARAS